MIPSIPVTFHLAFVLLPTVLVLLAVALAWRAGRRRSRPGSGPSGTEPPSSRAPAPGATGEAP